jgi:hypothetical protein
MHARALDLFLRTVLDRIAASTVNTQNGKCSRASAANAARTDSSEAAFGAKLVTPGSNDRSAVREFCNAATVST